MRDKLLLIGALFMLGPPAIAGDFYVGASIGVSMIDGTVDTANNPPDGISLNGRSFDSNETTKGITIGWNAKDWIAVELAYTDFGNAGQETPVLTVPTGPIEFNPPVSPPFIDPPPVVFFPSSIFGGSALAVEEWSLAARFRKALVSGLSANWSVGITRAQFDAEGSLSVAEVVTVNPLVVNRVEVPYASPEDETGYYFGFGFEWGFSDLFSADIGYRRHDTRVIDVETVTLRLIATF